MADDRWIYDWKLTAVTPDGPKNTKVYHYEYEYSHGSTMHVSFYEHPNMLGFYVLLDGKAHGIHGHLLTGEFEKAKLTKASTTKLTTRCR